MKKRRDSLRDKLIGLGEDSLRKSYYPELQRKVLELEESKKKILEGFNEKREFMRNVLHELRTPIHGVNTLIYLLQSTELGKKQKQIVEDIVSSLTRLENLIGEIQNLANSGVFGTDAYIPVAMNDLLENTVSPILSRKCVSFTGIIEDESVEQKFIAKQEEITNALRCLCEHGTNYCDQNEIEFLVRILSRNDANVEISFELILFNKFLDSAQIDRFLSLVQSEDASGNALLQSKSILLAFGGTYEVEVSGKGTVYRYTACFERYAPAVELQDLLKTSSTNLVKHHCSILVVEDNEINRNAMEMLLEDYECEVDMARNGKEGVELFKERKYCLIFMDIKMPVMSGEEAIQLIRKHEAENGGHTPIIAMTAFAMSGDRDRFLSLGADEYLAKPFDYDDFEKLLSKFVKEEKEAI